MHGWRHLAYLALSIGTGLAGSVFAAAPAVETTFNVATPAAQQLRGFGRVATDFSGYKTSTGAAWSLVFSCEGPAKAGVLAGKFLADLQLSPGVTAAPVSLGDKTFPAWTVPGGAAYLAAVDGATARILSAESVAALSALLAARPELAEGALRTAPYPAFLDRFDRYGWGLYGMNGYAGGDYQQHVGKYADPEAPKTPAEDLDWLIKNQFRFEPWLDPAGLDNSDGIVKNTEAEWMVKKAAAAGLPISFRVYGEAGGGSANWADRRFPEYAEQPAEFMMSGWHGASQHYKSSAHLTWFNPDIHRYLTVKAMDMIRPYAANPMVMGWMHPHGELAHDEWFDVHDDYSISARKSWIEYLRAQNLTLPELSRMYARTGRPFGSWDEITIPEFASFAGLNSQVQDLGGKWWCRIENPMEFAPDSAWWARPVAEKYAGLREKWWQEPIDGTRWKLLTVPGGEDLFTVFPRTSNSVTSWFRRSFDLTPAQLALPPSEISNLKSQISDLKSQISDSAPAIYLYWFPMSQGGIHTGKNQRYHEVYVNGVKAGEIGTWGALDVTKLVRPGANEIALHLLGSLWNGRIFLSTEAPRVYPYLGHERNQLWILWHDWHADTKFAVWREFLDGMRQVDPDRPVKFMAPMKFGTERWVELATRYGGFGHFTGEGMWYFPWYKRYAFLYDVPGSSETAGPPDPKNTVADQYDSFRRTFLAGLNAHDPVFVAQWYTRHADLRKWWEAHNPVLKQMGKYDLAGPQVLLYRSSKLTIGLLGWKPYPELGQATRELQSPWDWDIGRGTLQTLGQSCLYIDDGGLADGKMSGYKLMIDCGNETVAVESVDEIEAWVRSGGTYVTFPFTGRNSVLDPDSWPINTLTGCEVRKLRTPGTGTVTILKEQSVFKALAGKTFPDQGRSVDCNGGDHNLISTELVPGPDCDILATFENGAPAIVRHRIGKGAVIVLGSAFWRSSQDLRGVWWPEPIETDFIADLLAGIGYPAAPGVVDNRLVWPQPYVSNNGLDLVTCLVSWNDDKDVETTLRLRLPQKPASLICYGVDGEKTLPFAWVPAANSATGFAGEAVTKVQMPAKEVKVVRATGCAAPFRVVSHWWTYQQRMWHELAKPTVDFTPYTQGKWADPTLDLRQDARLTSTPPTGDAWLKPGFDDQTWKNCVLGVLDFEGADSAKPIWVRKSFTVPATWSATGGRILLESSAWTGRQYLGNARLWLNGVMLHDFPGGSYNEIDATRLLQDGENVVAFEFKGDAPTQGILGQLYLYHLPAPLQTIPLTGAWTGWNEKGQPVVLNLPGKGKAKAPARALFVPKEWNGKYQVRVELIGNRESILGVWINGHLVRRHHHGLGERCDVDITRFLQYGQDNELRLAHQNEGNGADPRPETVLNWDLRQATLNLYPALVP